MLKSAGLGCAIIAAILALHGPAAAQGADPAAQGIALVKSGRAAQAYPVLAPLAAQKAGNPEFDYALGIAALDSGKPTEAMVALQRVLAVQPNNGPARAELARAYAMVGDADTARKEFDTVVGDPTVPDPVRQRFSRIIGQLDREIAGGGTSVTGFVEGGLGYDSNVNSATALDSLVIPLFAGLGPATLSAGATEIDDGFARLEGGVSLAHGLSRQTRLFASLLGSAKQNFSEDAFDQTSLVATGGGAYTFPSRVTVSGALQVQKFWFGGSTYRDSHGLTTQATKPLDGGAALSLSAQYFDVSYPTDPLRDGDRAALGVSYATRLGVAAVQFGRERTDDPTADHFSNDFYGVSVAVEHPLSSGMALTASLASEARDYEAADPLFLAVREDRQFDASLGLKIALTDRLMVRPQLTYTRNKSNIALYDYERTTAAVTLRTEF